MADAPDPPRPDPLADPAALADLAARAAGAGGAAALGHFRHPALVSDNKSRKLKHLARSCFICRLILIVKMDDIRHSIGWENRAKPRLSN